MVDLLLPEDTRLDVVKILENHRRECEISGDYASAEVTRRRLEKLTAMHVEKHTQIMEHKQESAIDTLKAAYEVKCTEFERRWAEEEFPNVERQVEKMRAEIAERQAVELHRFQAQRSTEQYKPKKSGKILSERRRLDAMGAQGDYKAAKTLKAKIESQEQEELEKAHSAVLKSWRRREKRFLAQQQRDKDLLESKLKQLKLNKEQQKAKEAADMHGKHQAALARVQAAHASILRKKAPPKKAQFTSILPPLL